MTHPNSAARAGGGTPEHRPRPAGRYANCQAAFGARVSGRLQGKVAVVTGAARGIGRAAAARAPTLTFFPRLAACPAAYLEFKT